MSAWRWSWSAVLAVPILLGTGWSRGGFDPDWLVVNGHDWQKMDANTRQAYVKGFLAGAALGQAAMGARDTAAVRAELEALRGGGRLRFPYGANVYLSRVSDFYWWKNHLPLPTWYAFLEVNTTLGRPVADSVP